MLSAFENTERKLELQYRMGDNLQLEPTKLFVDKEVNSILDNIGFLPFLEKFEGMDLEISKQFAFSWKDTGWSIFWAIPLL